MNESMCRRGCRGFTLTELAVVLVIVALLIGGLLVPLGAQDELRRKAETQKTLRDIHDALLGFAAANGRLPCPATATSNGQENFAAGNDASTGRCSNFYDGFVPAATLGITPVNDSGIAIDAWDRPIRYAVWAGVINAVANPFTRTNGMRSATMDMIAGTTPLIAVCTTSTGVTSTACSGATTTLTNSVPALVFSGGKLINPAGADAGANRDDDSVFVSHVPTGAGAANGEFDDLVIWLSPNILFNKMIAAGQLP